MATNGDTTLYESTLGVMQGLKLTPGSRAFDRDFQFPLSLGRPRHDRIGNLGELLFKALSGEAGYQDYKIETEAELEGRSVWKIDFTLKYGTCEYWCDMERGCVPVRIISNVEPGGSKAGYQSIYTFDDIRFVQNKGWLPHQETWWHGRNSRAGRLLITKSELDSKLKADEFAIDFPKAITLHDRANEVRYPARKSWNLLRMPGVHSPASYQCKPPRPARATSPTLKANVPLGHLIMF